MCPNSSRMFIIFISYIRFRQMAIKFFFWRKASFRHFRSVGEIFIWIDSFVCQYVDCTFVMVIKLPGQLKILSTIPPQVTNQNVKATTKKLEKVNNSKRANIESNIFLLIVSNNLIFSSGNCLARYFRMMCES